MSTAAEAAYLRSIASLFFAPSKSTRCAPCGGCAYPHVRDAGRLHPADAKVLIQMQMQMQINVQLQIALSDIRGVRGQAILRALLAGERDPKTLAKLRDPRCQANETGDRPESARKLETGSLVPTAAGGGRLRFLAITKEQVRPTTAALRGRTAYGCP